jgi:ferredoxin
VAIFAEDDVPKDQQHFIALNAELCTNWPVITQQKPPPEDAAEWDGKPDKLKLLER